MTSKPLEDGTFNGQLSEDLNWMWLENQQTWAALYAQDIADSGFSIILSANGLS